MRGKRILFLLMFPLVIILAQNLPLVGKEIKQIYLEEVLSIGDLDDNDVLYMWVDVKVDENNFIYVTDTMDYSLKKFNSQGNLIKKIGKKGQGPGEFQAPRFMGLSEKFIYVSDERMRRIQVFDKELNFIRSIPVRTNVAGLKVLSDDKFVISSTVISRKSKGKILIINAEGKIIDEFVFNDKDSPFLMDTVSLDFDTKGNLYVAYLFQNRIEKIDPKENRVWSRKLVKIKKKIGKIKVESFTVPTDVFYKHLTLDSSGNIYILGGQFSKNRSRDVYVLNPEGELLTTFTLPDTSHCIYIDKNDYLYSRANEGVTLKKYKIKYK